MTILNRLGAHVLRVVFPLEKLCCSQHARTSVFVHMCVRAHACRFTEDQSTHVPAFTAYGDITREGMRRLLFLAYHPIIALLLGISFCDRSSSGLCSVMCLVEKQPTRGCFSC